MIYPYPATAVLAGNGIGTAGLAAPSGFGENFGEAFGGWVTTVTATIAPQPQGTATLASNGVGTAVATEVLMSAELQLV